ncbi:MAG: aldo/keto reductase [Eubacteriales bacterium]
MEYLNLGNTGIKVSRLCFGTLTLSPLQKNLGVGAGAKLLIEALDSGINFFDTAELYDNYDILAQAFENRPEAVIATKCYAYDTKTAQNSLDKALTGLKRENIDLFLLHEQESALTLKGHREAIDFFLKKKQEGVIKAFGISTHYVAGVTAAIEFGGIDVIHAICNKNGFGIVDGTREEMEAAILNAHHKGIGVYGMKALGGGHLIGQREDAMNYVLNLPGMSAVAVGMQNTDELDYNVALFEGRNPSAEQEAKTAQQKRKLFIHHDWCTHCGTCVARCQQGALSIKDGKVTVEENLCVLCSYCAAGCKELAIKVI